MRTDGEILRLLGGMAQLVTQALREFSASRRTMQLIVQQVYLIGMNSLPLIIITGVSTGMVMALQFGLGLEKFGGKLYVPKIVSLSIVREMGPVFTSLMLAARVGAGMASEIGSMVVTQQVDAIRALGTSPIQKIVLPRVIGSLVAVPTLVVFANIVGITGGLLVGVQELGLAPDFYAQKVVQTLTRKDYLSGLGKAPFFALTIALVSCYFGLTVRGGTRGVGEATTKAVVFSSIFILIGDYFLTKAFWLLEKNL